MELLKTITDRSIVKHCFDSLEDVKNSKIDFNEILERWEKLGVLEGLDDSKKELCALSFEQIAALILFSKYKFYDDCVETLIFPCIRMVITEVGEKYSTKKLYNSIYDVKLSKLFDKILFGKKYKTEIDIEDRICGAMSGVLVKIMNGEAKEQEFFTMLSEEIDKMCLK